MPWKDMGKMPMLLRTLHTYVENASLWDLYLLFVVAAFLLSVGYEAFNM